METLSLNSVCGDAEIHALVLQYKLNCWPTKKVMYQKKKKKETELIFSDQWKVVNLNDFSWLN